MELAILMVVGMLGAAPMVGYWRARSWAERHGFRVKNDAGVEDLAISLD